MSFHWNPFLNSVRTLSSSNLAHGSGAVQFLSLVGPNRHGVEVAQKGAWIRPEFGVLPNCPELPRSLEAPISSEWMEHSLQNMSSKHQPVSRPESLQLIQPTPLDLIAVDERDGLKTSGITRGSSRKSAGISPSGKAAALFHGKLTCVNLVNLHPGLRVVTLRWKRFMNVP